MEGVAVIVTFALRSQIRQLCAKLLVSGADVGFHVVLAVRQPARDLAHRLLLPKPQQDDGPAPIEAIHGLADAPDAFLPEEFLLRVPLLGIGQNLVLGELQLLTQADRFDEGLSLSPQEKRQDGASDADGGKGREGHTSILPVAGGGFHKTEPADGDQVVEFPAL